MMSSVEFVGLDGMDGISRVWLLLLAFTAATLAVAALRQGCRRLFGAERAFQLWLLPPLALLATQLPHVPGAHFTALPAMVYMITSAARVVPSAADGGLSAGYWRFAMEVVWCVGFLVSGLLAAVAQRRYRRRLLGATPLSDMRSRWPVLRAASANVGPALVGAWRSRIVLPADFEARYSVTEQMLILAHEAAHARRGDGWWCLLAQIMATMFWFHPLAWWALSALRQDQELACDAAVLREHGAPRRSYANAMLKTQSARFSLPVGCHWSPRHPLTERIAMLNSPLPGRRRRTAGMIASLVLGTAVAGFVYAGSAPSSQVAASSAGSHEYQLDMAIELTTDDAHARHAERTMLALCMAPGKLGSAVIHGWEIDATTVSEGENRVRVDLAVQRISDGPVVRKQLHGAFGEPLHAAGHGLDGKHRFAIDVTPLAGCPARVATAETGVR